jgi:hypothetical protein
MTATSTSTRRLVLVVALALTVWLAYRAPERDAASSDAEVQVLPPASRVGAAVIDRQRKDLAPAARDPFNPPPPPRTPPPPKPVVVQTPPPPPAPPPSAPPLPFSYFGLIGNPTGSSNVFIAQGTTLLAAKPGLVIDGIYRIERVTEQEIVFTYLPLGQTQALRVAQ